jgi:magnesium chelatase family protein
MAGRYQKRISGSRLDSLDIHIEVPRVEYEKLSDDRLGESSATIRKRVEAARAWQLVRFEGTRMLANADMGPGELRDLCRLDDAGKGLLKAAMQQLHMSARAYPAILSLALVTRQFGYSAPAVLGYRQVSGSKLTVKPCCEVLQAVAQSPRFHI